MLQQLLGLEFPEGSRLTSMGLVLRGGLPVWLIIAMIVAAIGSTVYIYRRERAAAPFRHVWLLTALRALALTLLITLVARPAVVAEAQGQRPRFHALLVDNSQSMKQIDRRLSAPELVRVALALGQVPPTAKPEASEWQSAARDTLANTPRLEVAKGAINNSQIRLRSQLESVGPLQGYVFGAKTRRVDPNAITRAMTAEEDRTAILDCIMELVTTPEGDPPAGILLITDGLDNASKATLDEVAGECKKLGVDVHVYGVGSTESGAVRLVDAAVPETLFVDDVASIPVRWRYRGTGKATARIVATLAGQEVAEARVELESGDGKVLLPVVPEKRRDWPPKPELVVGIHFGDDLASADEIKKQVTLSERKVRVLVVDNAPRWEFKFLQPALSRDRRVEATYFVVQGDPRAMKSEPFIEAFPTRDKLFTYDVVILGDVPPAVLGPDGVNMLVDYVREGGGLAIIAGRKHNPADYVDTPLYEALPLEMTAVRFPPLAETRTSAANPELTAPGRRSEMLSLADLPDENERTWRELPGIFWQYPVGKLRPGATALLTMPKKFGDESAMPLIATQNYGKGQVLFLGTDETWRWRYNTGDALYARFWGQIVYQLGLPHLMGHGQRTQLALDRADAIVGRPGYVYARLFDAEYRPFIADKVAGILESLDAPPGAERSRPLTLDPIVGRPGEYRALLAHDAPGRFEIKVSQPETGSLSYRVVLPPGHELEPAGLAAGPLQELAKATSGKFLREENLVNLSNHLTPKFAPFTARQEAILWGPLALILFVGLVTAEWIIRKLVNLS
jgi:hypothetical protein